MGSLLTAKSLLIYILGVYGSPSDTVDVEQAYCLALNVYHEARSESMAGQIQVAHATLARVADKRFPDNICDVVLDSRTDEFGRPALYKCSFSWFCDGKPDDIQFSDSNGNIRIIERANFAIASLISIKVMLGKYTDQCDGANFYYNPKLAHPVWADIYTKKCEIGDHVFLKREKGSLL